MKRLLITGANGRLGSICREGLTHMADILRLSSRSDMGNAAPHEEIIQCDIGDKAAVERLVEGCDGIIHMGGQPKEAPWEVIRQSNIDGMVNLYEAARKNGNPRIVFASSNHATGFYKQTQRLDANSVPRPDSLYGVSKVFGEALASMYHDKFGIETACVRIGSCFPEPTNHRMLATWMSRDDFILLIERIFAVPRLGCPIIYGVSNNDATWWDNRETAYIGWRPRDNAETFRETIDEQTTLEAGDDVTNIYQGGAFAGLGILEN